MLGNLSINNPCNIRNSSDRFIGEVVPSSNLQFKEFSKMTYGYRAYFKIINTYKNKYGLSTISGIITRFAPPSENDTQAYISFVADSLKVSPNSQLTFDSNTLVNLGYAMSYYENGIEPNILEVQQGLELASVIDIVKGVSFGGLLVLSAIVTVVFFSKREKKSST